MSRKYSPNHPAVMSAPPRPAQDLNRLYRLPLTGFAVSILGGVVAMSYLPTVAVFGFPFGFVWAAPFIVAGMACGNRCLNLLDEEKKRG